MATGYVVPDGGDGQDIDALATALAGEVNVSDATEVIDIPEVNRGRMAVKVTATATADITNAIAAVGDCQVLPGTTLQS